MKPKRTMILLAVAASIYAGWCALLYAAQDSIFFPGAGIPGKTPAPPPGLASHSITHPDGARTEYWVSEAGPGPVVIYLHGNGERIEYQGDVIAFLRDESCTAVLPEYRGYGSSEGRPAQDSVTHDLARIVDRLLAEGIATPDRLVYWGRSIGASFAAQLALHRPPEGLILQTPLARADSRAWLFGAPPFLVKHPLRTDRALARIDARALIIQHTRDTVAPPKDAERLAALRPDAAFVAIDAAHNDSGSSAESAREDAAIREFLQRTGGPANQ